MGENEKRSLTYVIDDIMCVDMTATNVDEHKG
jgi:hypothetical protein